ncbi:hypothetical protein TRVL_01293 [Trypanosoma vivax]|nr:hypothetical protein TRVL_01293 [Trypanosoma vivax]
MRRRTFRQWGKRSANNIERTKNNSAQHHVGQRKRPRMQRWPCSKERAYLTTPGALIHNCATRGEGYHAHSRAWHRKARKRYAPKHNDRLCATVRHTVRHRENATKQQASARHYEESCSAHSISNA